jgi:hypothetical protein
MRKMIIVGDATTWSITYNHHSDDSRDIIYNRNIFITLATVINYLTEFFLHY